MEKIFSAFVTRGQNNICFLKSESERPTIKYKKAYKDRKGRHYKGF